jgi:hypothetical protein
VTQCWTAHKLRWQWSCVALLARERTLKNSLVLHFAPYCLERASSALCVPPSVSGDLWVLPQFEVLILHVQDGTLAFQRRNPPRLYPRAAPFSTFVCNNEPCQAMLQLPEVEFHDHADVSRSVIQFVCVNLYYSGPERGRTFFQLGADVSHPSLLLFCPSLLPF